MRKALRSLLAVAAVVALLFLSREQTLPLLGRWLDVSEPPRPSDYVMVLGGHNDTRPFAAADLLLRGLADRALVTASEQSENSKVRWTQVYAMVHCGVPKDRIEVLPGECFTTIQEAYALAKFLQSHPRATVGVVTNSFHTRRARVAFRAALGSRIEQVYFVAAPNDGFDKSNWWKHEDGFVWYMMEIGKLSFYVLRYGNGLWWCAVFALGGLATLVARCWLARSPHSPVAVEAHPRVCGERVH